MVLIIDPQNSGIAGNMIAGAFVDLGVKSKEMKEIMETATEDFGGVKIQINKVNKKGIEATYLEVETLNESGTAVAKHTEGSDYADFGSNDNLDGENSYSIKYNDFLNKINELEKSDLLDKEVFDLSKRVFDKIAISEAKIHGKPLSEVHFHEVGAADAVADVFGSVYGFYKTCFNEDNNGNRGRGNKEKVIGLPIALGGGTTNGSHGRIPIPAPATVDILKGINCFGGPVATELATPTGVALFSELCDEFKEFQPLIQPEKMGYGAGKKDLDFPNVLRLIQGTENIKVQKIEVLETNLDHLSGESLGYLFDKLLEEGARDVAIVPILMKKNRPGHILKVICKKEDSENLISTIFRETGTLGIRTMPYAHRGIADRKTIAIDIDIKGIKKVKFKLGLLDNEIISHRPEYEDIRRIASETGLPLNEVLEIANFEIKKYLDS